MKRIAILVVMALLSLEVSARSVHYFTYSQATRTVSYLNAQNEMMIYFGYEYELPTYVLINEVWMERVNSSYYELWVYGYDAYTGDEIYMPLDLEGVWLFSGGRMYNAAQYLRFRVDVRMPTLTWYIPPYHPYTRVTHRHGYVRTYHYDIHRHGWMPPAYTYGPGMPPPPLPYYYMRHPNTPAPMPTGSWTPGSSRPTINTAEMTRDHNPSTGTQVRSSYSGSSTTTSTTRAAGGTRGGDNSSSATPSTTRSTTETRTSGTGTTETRGSSRTSGTSETRGTSKTRSGSGTRSTTETRGTAETRNSSGTRSTTETRSTTPTRSTVETRSSSTRNSEAPAATRSSSTRSSETPSTTRSTTSRSSSATTTTPRSSSTRGTTNTRTR